MNIVEAVKHELKYREEVFKKRNLKVSTIVDEKFDFNLREDYAQKRLIYELEGYIWGQEAERVEVKVDYPEDWWQAFKERWFPGWWLNRYPVKYTRIRKALVAEVLYPDLRIVEPDKSYVVKVFEEYIDRD